MSRGIKFRAWNKKLSIMCYGNEDESAEDLDGLQLSRLEMINDSLTDDEYIFLQYTGLKDKSGVELYEGDIFEYSDRICVVKFGYYDNCEVYEDSDNGYGFYLKAPSIETGFGSEQGFPYSENGVLEYVNVLGNIYENPEPLDKE